jgi:regulator of protease activity HflC (stomatin/prohibitin superfamily)
VPAAGWGLFLSRLSALAPAEEAELKEAEAESLLWANQHSDEEFSLLLGDGRDLIAADGVLHYRISDPHRYLSSTQNPEQLLEALAYRVLMHETARRTLEQALSENLNQLAAEVTQAIRSDVAAADIGLEPTGFYFSALHPPVAVAKDYQAVISAQIEERTKIIRAETHRRRSLPRAQSDAVVARSQANAEASLRLAEAVGEAAAFESLSSSVRSAEELYVFRRQAEALEQNLTGRNLMIVDHRIERDGGELWIKE